MKSPANQASPGRRLLTITLLTALGAFVVLLFHALFTFPLEEVLIHYTGRWVFTLATLRLFRYLMPIVCSGYMIALSLRPGYIIPKGGERSIGRILLFFIVVTFFATFFNEISVPRLNQRISSMRTATRTALDFKERALEEIERENYPEALTYLSLYSSMNPRDTAVQPLLDEIKSKAERQLVQETAEDPPSSPEVQRVTNMTAEELTVLARDYLDKEDYRSAYYYSDIAERLGYSEATRVKQFAAAKLNDLEPERETRETWNLHKQKQEGLSLLEHEVYIEAYYHFLNLSNIHPRDPDIQRYLEESREQVQEVAFFYEDIEDYLLLPGARDLVLLNRRTDDYVEFISIDTLFRDAETAFFEGVEVLRVEFSNGRESTVVAHFSAPYGKYQNGSIKLKCISRNDPEVQFPLRHLSDSPGGPLDSAISLGVPLEALTGFTPNPYAFEKTGLFELIEFIDLFPDHGLRNEPVMSELLRRAMFPFSFLIMILLFSSAGLHWKRQGYKVSFLSYLIIPAIPFVLFFLIQGFLSIEKSLLDFILLKTGILPAAFVFLALQGILTLFAVAVFTRKVLTGR